MTRRTAFERDHRRESRDPEYRRAFETARARIDTIDRVVRALDARRRSRGISKAELARRLDVHEASIRRLFTNDGANPTLGTVADIAGILGLELRVTSAPKRRPARRSARRLATS